MTETKRGRKSQSNYRALVGKALFADRFALEEFPVLSQLPAVEQWAAAHQRELLPHGKALQIILRQAVEDVIARIGEAQDTQMRRLIDFLRSRYIEQASVKVIAESWGCSTVHVWRSVGQRALDLVTDRFLELGRTSAPVSENSSTLSMTRRIGAN